MEFDKQIMKFIQKGKNTYFRTYSKVTVIRREWTRIKSPETDLHTYENLEYDIDNIKNEWENNESINKLFWNNWLSIWKNMQNWILLYMYTHTQLISRWIHDSNAQKAKL